VIEQALDHMRGHVQSGQVRREGPAQIVQSQG
jgi:hypothetical protein